jgi:hydrogenase-4 component F
MVNNGLVKGVMFMSAGNIHRAYGSKQLDSVRGALHRVPLSAALFLVGFIAVTGSPPFGPFVSEFTVLSAAVGQGRFVVAGGMLLFLLIVFMGMGATVLAVVQGPASASHGPHDSHEHRLITLPPLLLLLASLAMGLVMPGAVRQLIEAAASYVGGAP